MAVLGLGVFGILGQGLLREFRQFGELGPERRSFKSLLGKKVLECVCVCVFFFFLTWV